MNVEFCRGSTVSTTPATTTTGNRPSLCYHDELCKTVAADNQVNLLCPNGICLQKWKNSHRTLIMSAFASVLCLWWAQGVRSVVAKVRVSIVISMSSLQIKVILDRKMYCLQRDVTAYLWFLFRFCYVNSPGQIKSQWPTLSILSNSSVYG